MQIDRQKLSQLTAGAYEPIPISFEPEPCRSGLFVGMEKLRNALTGAVGEIEPRTPDMNITGSELFRSSVDREWCCGPMSRQLGDLSGNALLCRHLPDVLRPAPHDRDKSLLV